MTARRAVQSDPGTARQRGRRPIAIAAAAVVTLLAVAAVAVAAPATGAFHNKSGLAFSFSIKKGSCEGAPDPSNPSALAGPKKRGYCFETTATPAVNLTCPAPASSVAGQASLDELTGIRLSPSGMLVVKDYTYQGTTIIGDTELSLKVSGKKASGFVDVTAQGSNGTTSYNCDSGQLAFTAVRG
jgi:hypothetical protein